MNEVGKLGILTVFATKSMAVETNDLFIKGQFSSVDEENGRAVTALAVTIPAFRVRLSPVLWLMLLFVLIDSVLPNTAGSFTARPAAKNHPFPARH